MPNVWKTFELGNLIYALYMLSIRRRRDKLANWVTLLWHVPIEHYEKFRREQQFRPLRCNQRLEDNAGIEINVMKDKILLADHLICFHESCFNSEPEVVFILCPLISGLRSRVRQDQGVSCMRLFHWKKKEREPNCQLVSIVFLLGLLAPGVYPRGTITVHRRWETSPGDLTKKDLQKWLNCGFFQVT